MSNRKLVKKEDDSWKINLIEEYKELKAKYIKLHQALVKYDAGKFNDIRGKVRILRKQAKAMGEYLYCLEVRAKAEGIDLR